MDKKGNFQLLQAAALAFILISVLLTIGLDVNSDVAEDICTDGGWYYNASSGRCQVNGTTGGPTNLTEFEAFNASRYGSMGMSDLADNLTTIATVVGAVVLLGFLGVRLFGKRF